MALFSKKEFAGLCGISTRELAVYLKREKVVIDSNQMIDEGIAQNADFILKFKDKRKAQPSAPEKQAKATPATVKGKSKVDKEDQERKGTLYDLDKQRKSIDLRKKANEIDLQRIEIAKKQGELVPTSLVQSLIIQHSEAMRLHYNQATENLITIYNAITKLTAEQQSDIKKKMDVNVNDAIDKIIITTKKNLKNIVDEYSERRGVGQHD